MNKKNLLAQMLEKTLSLLSIRRQLEEEKGQSGIRTPQFMHGLT